MSLTFTACYYAKTLSGSDDRMNHLSLACGDTNACQDEFLSLYIHVPNSSSRVLIDRPFLAAHSRSRSTKAAQNIINCQFRNKNIDRLRPYTLVALSPLSSVLEWPTLRFVELGKNASAPTSFL